ncbi:MAG: hypothetical protein Q7S32_03200 [bacterium]|nr:hypothetical protein [bacterium]
MIEKIPDNELRIRDVLELLKSVSGTADEPIQWYIEFDSIRVSVSRPNIKFFGHRIFCPVTFACFLQTGEFYRITNITLAGQRINLSEIRVKALAVAADSIEGRPRLRRRLLKAVRLNEMQ